MYNNIKCVDFEIYVSFYSVLSSHPSSRSAFASNTVQQLLELADNANSDPSTGGYLQSFVVTYLGSMEVAASKGTFQAPNP